MILNEMNDSINNQTTDKGWAAMQQLLDQEMPTAPKRRRFIWWWLVVLILPLVAYGGWRMTLTPSATPMLPVERPIAPASRLPVVQQIETPAKQEYIQETKPSNDTARRPQTGRDIRVHSNNHPNTLPGTAAQLPANTASNTRIGTAVGNETLPVTPSTEPVTTQPSAMVQAQLSPVDASLFSPAIMTELPLDILAVPTRPVENLNLAAVPLPCKVTDNISGNMVKPRKNSPKWSFGITTSWGTERFQAINSIAGGLAAEWHTRGRWGVRSGLQYEKYKPSALDQPVVFVQPDQYEEAVNSYYDVTDLTGNVAVPATGGVSLQETVIIPVSSLSTIELPLLASWRVARPIRLFAGLNTAYAIAVKTAVKSFSGQYSLKANNDQAINNLNSLAVNDIQRWRFDLQTGFGIRLGNRFELGVLAQLPIRKSNSSKVSLGSNDPNFAAESIATKNQRTPSIALQATYFFKSIR